MSVTTPGLGSACLLAVSQSTDTRLWQRKHRVYCGVQSKENGQLMFKRPSILMAFREGFLKTQCEGGGFRTYHQLMLKSTNFV